MVTFKMVGRLSMPRETEKFHPFTEQTYEKSGWKRKVLNFNVQSDTNSHLLQIAGGCFADGHGMIYTQKEVQEDGKRRTENIQIPFKDRLKKSSLDEVASSRKFVLDLEIPGRRKLLSDAYKKVKDGSTLTDEELKSLGLDDQSQVEAALKKSNDLRKEFISEWDFIDAVKAVLDDSSYVGKKFRIVGAGDYSYNERFYENLIPRRITLEADDAEEFAEETVNLFTNDSSVDDGSVDDLGKYYINGWHREYMNTQSFKGNVFVPIRIVRHVGDTDKAKKISKRLMELFKHDDEDTLYQCKVVLDMINGSPRVKLTPDMLSDDDKELLEMELITWSDLASKYGTSAYGERVTELRFERFGILNRQSTPAATAFTSDDIALPIAKVDDDALFEDAADGDDDI